MKYSISMSVEGALFNLAAVKPTALSREAAKPILADVLLRDEVALNVEHMCLYGRPCALIAVEDRSTKLP